MKKVFLLLFVIVALSLTSCGYSKESMTEALAQAEYEGYKKGYDEGEYYARGELERVKGELERVKSDYGDIAYDAGYEHGYEIGYEDGYDDCLEEYGLLPEPEVTRERPRLLPDA